MVERFTELELIVKYADKLRVKPRIGVRVKLASRGAGRWESSAGYRSKFGLTATEVVEAVRYLGARDMADCLRLLHFHMGSQVTNIRKIKEAITEAARGLRGADPGRRRPGDAGCGWGPGDRL